MEKSYNIPSLKYIFSRLNQHIHNEWFGLVFLLEIVSSQTKKTS
jgi:hypothetical protein